MTKEKRDRIREVLTMIREDCERDAHALDGKPFDGKTVAPILGEMYATMKALAGILDAVIVEQTTEETAEAK